MKTCVVTVHQAKTNLSRLLQQAANGDDIVISRGKKPVARLVPIVQAEGKRRPGALKGRLVVNDSFFEPLPADELAHWE